jgi:hypothetical protein
LVDHRVERDDTPDELASLRLRVRQLQRLSRQRLAEPAHDLGRQIGDRRS